MKTHFRFSLRLKFITTMTFVVVFIALVLSSFFIYTQRKLLRDHLQERTEDIAKKLADNTELNLQYKNTLDYAVAATLLEKVDKQQNVMYAVIYDRNADVLAKSGTTQYEVENYLSRTKPQITDKILFAQKEPEKRSYKTEHYGEIFEVLVPMVTYDHVRENIGVSLPNDSIKSGDTGEIVGIARVGVTVENVAKKMNDMKLSVIGITVIVVFASIIIAFLLINILLNPIKELILGTTKIAAGDLSYRVPLTSSDELSDLAESFNSMAQDLKSHIDELNNEKQDLLRLKMMLEQRSRELEETLDKMQNIQEELLRSEKFATIGRLAASVAHELRNPLASLKNISYYLSKMGAFQDDKAKKMLDMLSSDVTRANRIITDLLDYSRAKKLNSLEMFVDAFLDKALMNIALPENISVVKDFEHFKAVIDPDKMTQVIINIVSNAKDAMPDGGTISVSCKKTANKFEIRISDTGIGMSENTKAHVFDPLFTTKLKGIGLGLAIVKEIIDAHFGTIKASGIEGKGSEFVITLPAE